MFSRDTVGAGTVLWAGVRVCTPSHQRTPFLHRFPQPVHGLYPAVYLASPGLFHMLCTGCVQRTVRGRVLRAGLVHLLYLLDEAVHLLLEQLVLRVLVLHFCDGVDDG